MKVLRAIPIRNELESREGTVRLEPRVMPVLVVMAQRPGDVVTREELIQAVW